jgi:hypothetical protein
MTAIYDQALTAVRDAIAGITMTRIQASEIVVRKLPSDQTFWHRGITVSPDTSRIDDAEPALGTNERDMIGYPCVVTMVDGTGHGWADNISNIADWQQTIRRTFHNKRLSGLSETGSSRVTCKVTSGKLADKKQYPENLDVSQLVVWVWMLEKRSN